MLTLVFVVDIVMFAKMSLTSPTDVTHPEFFLAKLSLQSPNYRWTILIVRIKLSVYVNKVSVSYFLNQRFLGIWQTKNGKFSWFCARFQMSCCYFCFVRHFGVSEALNYTPFLQTDALHSCNIQNVNSGLFECGIGLNKANIWIVSRIFSRDPVPPDSCKRQVQSRRQSSCVLQTAISKINVCACCGKFKFFSEYHRVSRSA